MREEETFLVQAPRGSSKGNGKVERVIQTVRKQAKTLKLDLENSYALKATADSVIWPWLVCHAAWLVARFVVKLSGKSSFSMVTDTIHSGEHAPFGETLLWYMTHPPSNRIGGEQLRRAEPRWRKWVWLGRSEDTDEHLISTDSGVIKFRSVKRLEPGNEADPDLLLTMKGVPWDMARAVIGRPKRRPARERNEPVPIPFQPAAEAASAGQGDASAR